MSFRTCLCACAGILGCLILCGIARCDGHYYVLDDNPDSVLFNSGESIGARPVTVMLPDGTYANNTVNYDYDDLPEFNVLFDAVSTASATRARGAEFARIVWLGDEARGVQNRSNDFPWRSPDARQAHDIRFTNPDAAARLGLYSDPDFDTSALLTTTDDPHANDVGIVYGIRGIQAKSNLTVVMLGSVLHDVSVETEADNEILGPQVGFVLRRKAGRLSTQLWATLMAGFNFGDVQQQGTMGQGLLPGALNQPLYARTTQFQHAEKYDEFSPSGELRAEARYRFTNNVTVALAYSSAAVGNVLLTDDRMIYYLPDFGLADPGEQSIFVHSFYCGVELVL